MALTRASLPSESCPGRTHAWEYVVIALVLALQAGHLFRHPAADLPARLDGSAGLVFDGPSKCHNARNHALWGEWIIDEWTPVVHSPLHTLLQRGVYAVAGHGLAQIRILDGFATLLAGWFFWRLARHALVPAMALLATATWAGAYPFFIYGRSGLLEPLVIACGLGALLALTAGAAVRGVSARRARAFAALAGFCAGLSLLAKLTAWPYLVALLLAPLWTGPSGVRLIPWFLLGLLPVALVYGGWFIPALAWAVERESSFWAERAAHTAWWSRWLRQPLFVLAADLRWVLIAALPALAPALRREAGPRAGARIPVVALALVFLLGTQFFAFVSYRPLRYYLPYLPGAVLLAFWGVSFFARSFFADGDGAAASRPRRSGVASSLAAVFALACALHFGLDSWIWPEAWRAWRPGPAPRFLLHFALAAGLWVGARAAGHRMNIRAAWRPALAAGLALLLAGAHLLGNVPRIRGYLAKPSFTMRDFSRELGARHGDMTIGGPSPLFAVMENRHRAVKITAYNLNHEWMRNGRLTHLLIPKQMGHERTFKRLFPDQMERAVLIDRPVINGYRHELYALRPAATGQDAGTNAQ